MFALARALTGNGRIKSQVGFLNSMLVITMAPQINNSEVPAT